MRKSCLILTLAALGLALAASGVAAEETGHEHHDHEHMQHVQGQAADEGTGRAAGGAAGEADPHAAHRAMMEKPAEPAKPADVNFKDLPLVDQDGRELRLVSDLIGDRIVVMDFVYTTCTTVCPVLSALFTQVQDRLGERLGNEVLLVSITVDPLRDTPERLKAYAETRGARPGWVWLTGVKPTVDAVLDGLGAYSPSFENHPAMVLVGDGRTGDWSRFFGFPSPDRIMEQVDSLLAARHEQAGG